MGRIRRYIPILMILSLVVSACGTEADTTGEEVTTSLPLTSTTDGEESTIVISETDRGDVLVDGDGFTLYVFAGDGDGASLCEGECADTWPPFGPATPAGELAQSLFSVISRTDGTSQSAVRGAPLYHFSGDSRPGDTNGHGVGGVWFAVGPDGNPVGQETSTDTPGGDYGYDY